MAARYASFREFYPFYLSEHANRACRRLHFVGTSLVLGCVVAAIATRNAWWLALAPVAGYGFAWIGHFFFEHNRPATFTLPALQPARGLGHVPGHADPTDSVLTPTSPRLTWINRRHPLSGVESAVDERTVRGG